MADLVVGGSLGAGYQRPGSLDFPSIVPAPGTFHNRERKFSRNFLESHAYAFDPPANYEKFAGPASSSAIIVPDQDRRPAVATRLPRKVLIFAGDAATSKSRRRGSHAVV
jgi:hypothetical protein